MPDFRWLRTLLLLLFVLFVSILGFADDWKPITPEDLALKSVPGAPGAHAVMLYHENLRDDVLAIQRIYFRIKILSEEGKNWANVELPIHFTDQFHVGDVKARTVRPDGSIVPFEGKVFDKVVAKRKGYRWMTKTFTIPDVQVGSIIEYRYVIYWDRRYVYDSTWHVQQPLYLVKGLFKLKQKPEYAISWSAFGVENGAQVGKDGQVTLEVAKLEPYVIEPFMPPTDEVRHRVYFFYFRDLSDIREKETFWRESGKIWTKFIDRFLDKKKAMEREVATLVGASDTPEVKLRKIYDRAQKIRNLSYEEFTEKEAKQFKEILHVEDVLQNGYGSHNQINRTFVALARAAGLDARVVRVAERHDKFFYDAVMSFEQFDNDLAWVDIDGKELYLSPATPYCPFGVLPWEDMNVTGMRADPKGGTMVKVPPPMPQEGERVRTADLQIDREGTLTGTVRLTYNGLEALYQRLNAREKDETQRKKDFEESVREWLPGGSTVEFVNFGNWTSTEPLVVELKITAPGYAAVTSKRILVPTNPFLVSKGHAFQQARRVNPVYFKYPWAERDEITLRVPDGMTIEGIGPKKQMESSFGYWKRELASKPGEVKIHRVVTVDGLLFGTDYYLPIQQFFNSLKAADSDQFILKLQTTASN